MAVVDRVYAKQSVTGRLSREIIEAGFPASPDPGARFYGVSSVDMDTIVHVFDDLTAGEEAAIDAVVAAHVATPLSFPALDSSLIYRAFPAGPGGAPDDVFIYNEDASKMRVLVAFALIETPVAGATLTLRDAAGGGGSALSDIWDASVAGTRVNLGVAKTGLVPFNGTLAIHRSDSGIQGEIIIVVRPE